MRKLAISLCCIFIFSLTRAQSPVEWSYTSKKITDKTYEIHLSATVAEPWHIYSQFTPDGGPFPTKISFSKNPLVTISGKAKELGELEQKHENVFDVDVMYFDGKVDFVQMITLKTKVKTNISGIVQYMVCNDKQCMPPAKVSFTVVVQ